MSNTLNELSKTELIQLDNFLLNNRVLSLLELHCYFTAIISGPSTIAPSHWMQVTGINGINFDSQKQVQEIIGRIILFYNSIAGQLLNKTYNPLVFLNDAILLRTHENIGTAAAKWAKWYIIAVDDSREKWMTKKSLQTMNKLLTPIMSLNVRDSFIQEEIYANNLNVTPEEFRKQAIASFTEITNEIYAYWQAHGTQGKPQHFH